LAYVNKVPVLSKITVFILFKFSNKLFFLIKIPSYIAKFKVMATTLGIARPRAHGQLITSIYFPLIELNYYCDSTFKGKAPFALILGDKIFIHC